MVVPAHPFLWLLRSSTVDFQTPRFIIHPSIHPSIFIHPPSVPHPTRTRALSGSSHRCLSTQHNNTSCERRHRQHGVRSYRQRSRVIGQPLTYAPHTSSHRGLLDAPNKVRMTSILLCGRCCLLVVVVQACRMIALHPR